MSKVTTQDYIEYLELINDGHSQRSAAKILGIPRTTIQSYLKRVLTQEEIISETESRGLNYGVSGKTFNFPNLTESMSKCGESLSKLGKILEVKHMPRDEVLSTSKIEKRQKPKILHYDIETSLAKSYHFQQWKVNLSQKQKIQESHLLSHAWAWGDGEVVGSVLTVEEMLNHDPERLVLECWSLLDNCDILVAHNGKRFDVKKVNSYFLQYGMPPPSPYKVIDTLLIAKAKFALPFNSLAYLAEFLNVEQKIDTGGIDLWIRCDKGDPEALQSMLEYNMGDITTLRGVYNHLISWSNDNVNAALYSDHGASCPHCASADVSLINGKHAYTAAQKYSVYRCNDCSAVLRSKTKEGKGNSLVRVI